MTPDGVLHRLAHRLPPDAVVIEETPTHRDEIQRHIAIGSPLSYLTCVGGVLGWGLPAAVGAALARPDRKVITLLGDGATMYSVQALYTAARLNLPLTYLVLDNGGYGAMRLLADASGIRLPPQMHELTGLDLPAVARGLGCRAARVTAASDMDQALDTALGSSGPYLLDIAVDDTGADIYPPETP